MVKKTETLRAEDKIRTADYLFWNPSHQSFGNATREGPEEGSEPNEGQAGQRRGAILEGRACFPRSPFQNLSVPASLS